MDKTAVVILNYNGVHHLKRFLPRVVEYTTNCQIVVIDNNSTDESKSFLTNQHPEIQLIPLSDNFGYSGGYNKGLESIDASNYILLNSDVEVTPGWAEQLQLFMESHPEVGLCQPKILSLRQPDQFDYAGAAGGYLDVLGYPFCRGRIFNHLEKDQGQYDNNEIIFWASGCCLFVRSHIFKKLGGFDNDFFAHMEEIDLCWRAQRAGFKVAYVGSSRIFHLGGGTLNDTNPIKTYLNFRNGLQLLVKNSSIASLMWKIPLRMCLDILAGIRFLLQGSIAHLAAVLKAEIVFIFTFPHTWSKRNALDTPYRIQLTDLFLVWEYFVKGNRTYQKLKQSD